jgi:predicted phosphoribosyltransferase
MAQVRQVLDAPRYVFRDRREAGVRLAEFVAEQGGRPDALLAVPSGGVAVGRPLAERLAVPLGLVLVRKLPMPMAPEAGFGAVAPGGEVALNERLVAGRGLTREDVEAVVRSVLAELEEREAAFLAGRERVDPAGRRVLLVDDGLASGYTMMAAIGEVRRRAPAWLGVGVPDAPLTAIERVEPLADELYCLVAQRGGSFAVASYYQHWHDLTDREVLELLGAPSGVEEREE